MRTPGSLPQVGWQSDTAEKTFVQPGGMDRFIPPALSDENISREKSYGTKSIRIGEFPIRVDDENQAWREGKWRK